DLEAALHCGNRRLSAFRNESNRLVVKGIRLGIGGITPATTAAPFPFGAPFEHIIDVVWLAPLLPCIHHPMHLSIVHKGAMNPNRHTGAWRHVQHIPMAQQLICTTLIENGPGIDLGRYLERNSG